MHTALTIGHHAAASLWDSVGGWAVVASFADATYLSDGERMLVVTSRRVPCGPMYVGVDTDDVTVDVGARVLADPHQLQMGHLRICLDRAAVWAGRLPDSKTLAAASDELIDVLAPSAVRSEITAGQYASRLDVALAALEQADFDRVAWSLVGLGPGLTPAGDDVLAGLLVVAVAVGALAPDEWTPSAEVVARTSPLSLSFVRVAATGQAIAPVHDVLVAGAQRDWRVCRAAVEALLQVGATSGSDIAFGMWAGLRHLTSRRRERPLARIAG